MKKDISPRDLDTWTIDEILRFNAILDMQDDIQLADDGYHAIKRDAEDNR